MFLNATLAVGALSAKDAFRSARAEVHGLVTRPGSLPEPARRFAQQLDSAAEASQRIVRFGIRALPFAPRPLHLPPTFRDLDARRAREGEFSRLAIGDAIHDSLRIIFGRLEITDPILSEAALADCVIGSLDGTRGLAPHRRAGMLAFALGRCERCLSRPEPSEHRTRLWRYAALALATSIVVASEEDAGDATILESCTDLMVAAEDEALAAFASEVRLSDLIGRYAPHV